ncbi:MAG: AraC family transcriptional regulator [Pseudomonadales bacterium]|nr:AraC family transcriptional regulator [Pseudomonadales bacterium]NRA14081.1 AraC family transcriptional regulator [Oceanospirillaceae bacterium]
MIEDWFDLSKDKNTGIESIHAHFNGNAYGPHWHDSYLIGITDHGFQKFSCRGIKHLSTPGQAFMIEPGEIHDADAPDENGYTYRMLDIDPKWVELEFNTLFPENPSKVHLAFGSTLVNDKRLVKATAFAFEALHRGELQIVKEAALDNLLQQMSRHLTCRPRQDSNPCIPQIANLARDYIHANLEVEFGLNDLAKTVGIDRFRLTRAFKNAFGMAPYQYLIMLRIVKARQLLAKGTKPSEVATELCFSDQSHLGRWFKRVYKLTPSHYRRLCTNLLD